jgi:large subunit ribosomal protein L9
VKEVLLKESVENLGRRGEVVTVADGYARNYLLPRKLALPVTKSNQRQVEFAQAAAAAIEAEEQKAAEIVATRIGALECVIARRVGETDTLYGSVTSADIAEYMATQKVEIDRRKIQLADPIKELGESTVAIKLHRNVTAQLTVRVVKDTQADSPEDTPS